MRCALSANVNPGVHTRYGKARAAFLIAFEIEVLTFPDELPIDIESARGAGFRYVSLDLEGYRSGSGNRTAESADEPAAPSQGLVMIGEARR